MVLAPALLNISVGALHGQLSGVALLSVMSLLTLQMWSRGEAVTLLRSSWHLPRLC